MGDWCAEHLRDVTAWRDDGLPLSTPSDSSAKMFDATLRQLVSWLDCVKLGGLDTTRHEMLVTDPNFVMGQCLALGMHALGTSDSVRKNATFEAGLKKLESDAAAIGNVREQRHAKAVVNFAHGNMESACIEWEKILAEYPNDLMALKFAHDGYFFLGDSHRKRDSVARVLPKWKKTEPCYSYLHGMLAFGLEECGQYAAAEASAKHALSLQKQDCWATHAFAHVMEMEGRVNEGIAFMQNTESDWEPCHILACHNYWHNALFYIENGDNEAALDLFDKQVLVRAQSNAMLDVVDAASLLMRLEMEGVTVGTERWQALAPLAQSHFDDHTLAFNDAHISMIVTNLEDGGLARKHDESIKNFIGTGSGQTCQLMRDVGDDICNAVVAFNNDNFKKCFEFLYPVRTEIIRIGGSHAQRDVFTQMLLHSALKSGKTIEFSSLLQERGTLKPNSPLVERLRVHQKQLMT